MTWDDVVNLTSAFLVLAGSLFVLASAIGIVRMPDTFSRVNVVSMASTLGIGLLLLAVALEANDTSVITRIGAALGFMLITAPVGSHLLGRAAYLQGCRLARSTHQDSYRDYVNCHSTFRAARRDSGGEIEAGDAPADPPAGPSAPDAG